MVRRVRESSLPSGSSRISRAGVVDQGAGQGHALRHAAGELARPRLVEAGQADRAAAPRRPGRAAPRSTPLRLRPQRDIVPDRAPGNSVGSWNTTTREGRGRADLDAVGEDACRLVGGSSPATSRSSVDLPQPEGPSRATNSPGSHGRADPVQHRQGAPSSSNWWLTPRISIRAPAACPRLLDRRGYHLHAPFCQASSRSRSRNSSVIRPENSSAITISAAYMLE